jgi:uncharacterized membrane protein YqjE
MASQSPVQTHTAALDETSVGELTARLSEQVSHLVRDEMALAQIEAKEKAKRLGLGLGLFGGSGFVALLGVLCGISAAVLGLATVVDAWLAALLVALALFAAAGALAVVGRSDLRRGTPPVPMEAVASTKADVSAVREAVKR